MPSVLLGLVNVLFVHNDVVELVRFLMPPARKNYDAQFRRITSELRKLRGLAGSAGKLSLGNKVQALEKKAAQMLRAKHALFVTNATAGFEIAYKFAGLKPGDEVIAPSITFIATIAYPLSMGAKVVLADIDPRRVMAVVFKLGNCRASSSHT